jgi:hypothetical protein
MDLSLYVNERGQREETARMSIAVHPPSLDPGPAITVDGLALCDPGEGTGAWWVWECPCCGRTFEAELDACDVCIEGGSPLRKVGCSLPFIWIG